jgi:hypothetical protein
MTPPQQTNGEVRLPELLAPAGNWDALRAAVANGADAVYFGVEAFNARLRAANFQRQQLPELMHWLHQRGVKGFLTVNVLIFADEQVMAANPDLSATIHTYARTHAEVLDLAGEVVILPGGEPCKNDFSLVQQCWKAIHDGMLDRHSYVFVIGGGTVATR